MNIFCLRNAGAPQRWNVVRGHSTARAGFTMIEIAISLGIIAIALVAIIGILPKGLNTQKENRDDTIMNQDGPFFLEAIRNGAKGVDHLTNYVEWIIVSNETSSVLHYDWRIGKPPAPLTSSENNQMVNGESIIGLLSTPKYTSSPPTTTNYVVAYVRSLSGAAVEQGKASRELAFAYLLMSEVVPITNLYYAASDDSAENRTRSNEVRQLILNPGGTNANFHDIRLTFRWPVKPAPSFDATGNRKVFRAIVGGSLKNEGSGRFFIQPQHFIPAE